MRGNGKRNRHEYLYPYHPYPKPQNWLQSSAIYSFSWFLMSWTHLVKVDLIPITRHKDRIRSNSNQAKYTRAHTLTHTHTHTHTHVHTRDKEIDGCIVTYVDGCFGSLLSNSKKVTDTTWSSDNASGALRKRTAPLCSRNAHSSLARYAVESTFTIATCKANAKTEREKERKKSFLYLYISTWIYTNLHYTHT